MLLLLLFVAGVVDLQYILELEAPHPFLSLSGELVAIKRRKDKEIPTETKRLATSANYTKARAALTWDLATASSRRSRRFSAAVAASSLSSPFLGRMAVRSLRPVDCSFFKAS